MLPSFNRSAQRAARRRGRWVAFLSSVEWDAKPRSTPAQAAGLAVKRSDGTAAADAGLGTVLKFIDPRHMRQS